MTHYSNVSNALVIKNKVNNDPPALYGAFNVYPTGATVNITGLVDGNMFACIVLPNESVIVDGTTYTANIGNTNRDIFYFAKISGSIVKIYDN